MPPIPMYAHRNHHHNAHTHHATRPACLQLDAFDTIWRTEGLRGFYRGWAANSLKVIPQNAIRLVSYEMLKSMLGIKKAKTDT